MIAVLCPSLLQNLHCFMIAKQNAESILEDSASVKLVLLNFISCATLKWFSTDFTLQDVFFYYYIKLQPKNARRRLKSVDAKRVLKSKNLPSVAGGLHKTQECLLTQLSTPGSMPRGQMLKPESLI